MLPYLGWDDVQKKFGTYLHRLTVLVLNYILIETEKYYVRWMVGRLDAGGVGIDTISANQLSLRWDWAGMSFATITASAEKF